MKDGNAVANFYTGSLVYKGNRALDYIIHPEGMVLQTATGLAYQYHLKDHLGNTRVVFGANGAMLQQTDYYAFGMSHLPLAASNSTKYLYNGKELQDELIGGIKLDWYDYGARFYYPQIARWHSVDPHAENYYHASPFAYVENNPISRIDPDGRDWYENTKGARVWYEGSGEREGYTRSTQDFTVSGGGNTSYTYTPTQYAPVSETETVLQESQFVSQRTEGNTRQCFGGALLMTEKTGVTPGPTSKDGTKIAVESGNKIQAAPTAQEGMNYIDRAIDSGYAPTVGVNHTLGGIINGGTTDHYVTISSRTTNLKTGVSSYRFFDTGSSTPDKGTNPNFVFKNTNGLYVSSHDYKGKRDVTLSFVSYLKKK